MGMDPCGSSKTDSLVIAILEFILSILLIIVCAVAAVFEIIGSIFFIIVSAVGIAKVDGEGVKATAIGLLVMGIFVFFLAIFLLIGIRKELPSYLKLWIGVRTFVLVARIILLIVAVCAGGVHAVTIALYVISFPLTLLLIYVVYHFLKKLENGETANQGYPSNKV